MHVPEIKKKVELVRMSSMIHSMREKMETMLCFLGAYACYMYMWQRCVAGTESQHEHAPAKWDMPRKWDMPQRPFPFVRAEKFQGMANSIK